MCQLPSPKQTAQRDAPPRSATLSARARYPLSAPKLKRRRSPSSDPPSWLAKRFGASPLLLFALALRPVVRAPWLLARQGLCRFSHKRMGSIILAFFLRLLAQARGSA